MSWATSFVSALERSVDLVPWSWRDRIRRIPILAGAQRLAFEYFLGGRSFRYEISAGPAKGLVFPVSLPEDKLIWTGTWELQVTEVLAEEVFSGATCLDIGSHRGFMAGVMALHSEAMVYCFEPQPANRLHLETLARLNPELELSLMELAVSDCDGEAEFLISEQSSMGRLSDSPFQEEATQHRSIQVVKRSLDSLLAEGRIEPPDLIKVDVEGEELAVLEGALRLIADHAPIWVIELHTAGLARRCAELLRSLAYETKIIEEGVGLEEASFRVCHLLARPDA